LILSDFPIDIAQDGFIVSVYIYFIKLSRGFNRSFIKVDTVERDVKYWISQLHQDPDNDKCRTIIKMGQIIFIAWLTLT
jgi:hypothetical protein